MRPETTDGAGEMIPVGYMAKRVASKPAWLKNDGVVDICSVSACISEDFCDYIPFWRHNGYWLFDSPRAIREVAEEHGICLQGAVFFYYECYAYQYDEDEAIWETFAPEASFETRVLLPLEKERLGFDVVSFSTGNAPECSYLSCNHMAETIEVNEHCLLASLDVARALIERGAFARCEPGPCRILAVYRVEGV